CIPSDAVLKRLMAGFDWGARSRVIAGKSGISAAALVLDHPGRGGTLARLETAAQDEADRLRLIRWGIGLSRAVGARVVQVWRPKGAGRALSGLGLALVRPFWRMDRARLEDVPEAPLPDGYRLSP